MPITLQIPSVERATSPVETQDLREMLDAFGLRDIEATSAGHSQVIACKPYNGLLMAIHTAFASHYPLVLSPDHIWLCIAQGAARHIRENAEALRGRLVRHQGQVEIEVRRDEFIPGYAGNDWAGAVDELSEQMREHLGGRRDLFVCDFSTTDTCARTASEIVLMSGMQKFFVYTVSTLCGIPEVTLEGTPEDWKAIKRRAKALEEFDLGWWIERLMPVLDGLEATALGQGDPAFWGDIYKLEMASGGARVSGWINALFPYMEDDLDGDGAAEAFEWRLSPENAFEKPKVSDFPQGLSRAPFNWKFIEGVVPMQLVAGFFGVTQAPDSLALRPNVGWAVTPAKADRLFVCSPGRSSQVSVRPRDSAALTSLASLGDEMTGLEGIELWLWSCRALPSLEGIGDAKGLSIVTAMDCDLIEDLDALSNLPGLVSVDFRQCARLTDVGSLASLTSLERLVLMRCPMIKDISAIAELPKLSEVILHHCEAVPKRMRRIHKGRAAVEKLQAFLRS